MPDDSRLVVRIPYSPWQGPSGKPQLRARIVQVLAFVFSVMLSASYWNQWGIRIRGRGFVEFESTWDFVAWSTPVFLFAVVVITLAELDARGFHWSDVTTMLFAPAEAVVELEIDGTRVLLIDENLGRKHSCTLAGLQVVQDGRRVVLRMGREVFTYDLDDAEAACSLVARLAPRLA